jgi:predicted ATPase
MLHQIGVPYRVTVADLSTLTRTVDLRLEDRFNVHIGIPDVGFGVSQLLPILAQWAGMLEAREEQAPPGILLIEQPELHLHPAWQIGLVNAFAAPLNPRTSAPDVEERRKPQVVLETHAPVMVRAVQKLVRDGDLKAADVSLLVFDTPDDRGAARVQHVPLNSGGRFTVPWPNGFFPQEEELLNGRDS